MKTTTRIIIILFLLLSGCGPNEQEIAKMVEETVVAISSHTPLATLTPSPSITTRPTSTFTQRPTKTITPTTSNEIDGSLFDSELYIAFLEDLDFTCDEPSSAGNFGCKLEDVAGLDLGCYYCNLMVQDNVLWFASVLFLGDDRNDANMKGLMEIIVIFATDNPDEVLSWINESVPVPIPSNYKYDDSIESNGLKFHLYISGESKSTSLFIMESEDKN